MKTWMTSGLALAGLALLPMASLAETADRDTTLTETEQHQKGDARATSHEVIVVTAPALYEMAATSETMVTPPTSSALVEADTLNPNQGSQANGLCTPSADDDPATWICEAAACPISNATWWVRRSAEYRALVYQTFHFASLRAVQLGHDRAPGTWAVVVDLDETVMSNSAYTYERERCGLGYTRESWADWSEDEAATILPGVRAFIETVYAQGGVVVGVTNRRDSEAPHTHPILRGAGIQYEFVLFRGNADDATGEKEARFEQVPALLAERGYPDADVALYIGDQITDFPDLTQSDFEGMTEFRGPFGSQYFVLPNPMYGSWEPGGH